MKDARELLRYVGGIEETVLDTATDVVAVLIGIATWLMMCGMAFALYFVVSR
jgi:hypothetical protein